MSDGTASVDRAAIATPALAGLAAFLLTLGVDLGSKAAAVSLQSSGLRVVYDQRHFGDFQRRLLLSLVAICAVYALARLALWRGLGRLWGAWLGAGLLVGGIIGNGISHFIWARGTPDFIWASGPYVWNVADFAIGIGLGGGLSSIALTALFCWWRGRVGPR